MRSQPDLKVTFHVEPADRSVGIMAEGFSAWDENGTAWCDLNEIVCHPPKKGSKRLKGREEYRFDWYDNETGLVIDPPPDAPIIQALLQAYVRAWYAAEGPG